MERDEAYLKGYTQGDGSLYSYDRLFTLDKKPKILRGYEVCWGDKDVEQLKITAEILREKFPNVLSRIHSRKNTRGLVLKCYRKQVFNYIKELLNRDIGEENSENIAAYITGFCDAEADVSRTSNGIHKGKKYYRPRIQITQKNKVTLLKIKELLETRFGIKSNIYKKWNQDCHVLQITSQKGVNLFRENIGFRNPTKLKKLLSV